MKYTEEIATRICDLLAKDSYTIVEVCAICGISKQTFYEWKSSKPYFSDLLKKAENDKMEMFVAEAKKSLLKKIKGYEVDETKTTYVNSKDGKPVIKEQVNTKKHIQPDTGAIIFSLCNLDPVNWKNRQSTEVAGKDGSPLEIIIKIDDSAKQDFADNENDIE